MVSVVALKDFDGAGLVAVVRDVRADDKLSFAQSLHVRLGLVVLVPDRIQLAEDAAKKAMVLTLRVDSFDSPLAREHKDLVFRNAGVGEILYGTAD